MRSSLVPRVRAHATGRPPGGMKNRAALLKLAALDKSDFEATLQEIIRLDAELLGVERVSYWALQREPRKLVCELGYVRSLEAYESGVVVWGSACPRYFEALLEERVINAMHAPDDPLTRELAESYLGPRSISSLLDIPVWVQGKLAGVLCHEHTGAPRRWTASEQQLAIAVAQAVAATLEAREVGQAERAERRASFLADATAALAESLELEHIPERLVHLVVPALADWCIIDGVDEGGRFHRLAAAHVEPTLEPLLDELDQRHPPTMDGPHPSARTLRGRQSLLIPDINDELLERFTVSSDHAALVRRLGARSMMALPLTARGVWFGALFLASGTRSYDQSDLRLGEELARRAAMALDNARLHRQAREAIALREEFLSIAAHELYTPLTSLSLAAEELARGTGGQRSVDVVLRGAKRLTLLVDELLEAARTGAGPAPLRPQRVELSGLVRRVVGSLRDTAGRAGCPIELELDHPVEGCWDPGRMEALVTTLLNNAIKFGAGRPVEVEVRRADGKAQLSVCDHGRGIEPESVPHIFDRFERGVSPREYGGLGLGLYIAHEIAEAHGGSIRVQSTPGEGARFIVELPLAA
jgi:signal transduction histidine kinase